MHWSDTYVALAVQNPYGKWLREQVEERWSEWEALVERYHFKHSAEHIYAEMVWHLGGMSDSREADVEHLEKYIFDSWLISVVRRALMSL